MEYFETEEILPDVYPVYIDYVYIIDNQIMRSWLEGTAKDLKEGVASRVVRRCDIVKRGILK